MPIGVANRNSALKTLLFTWTSWGRTNDAVTEVFEAVFSLHIFLRANSSMLCGQSQAHFKDLSHIRNRPHGNMVVAAKCGRHGLLQSKWFSGKCRHGQTLAFRTYACTNLQKSWKRKTTNLCKTLFTRNKSRVLVSNVGFAVPELGNWITESLMSNHFPNCDSKRKGCELQTHHYLGFSSLEPNATFWLAQTPMLFIFSNSNRHLQHSNNYSTRIYCNIYNHSTY